MTGKDLPSFFHTVNDTSQTSWLEGAFPGPLNVPNRYIPNVYQQIIRICHPAWRWPDDTERRSFLALSEFAQSMALDEVRWEDVAKEKGEFFNGRSKWTSISTPIDPDHPKAGQISRPVDGRIPGHVLEDMYSILKADTGTDTVCMCAFWEGSVKFDIPNTYTDKSMGFPPHLILSASMESLFDYWMMVLDTEPAQSGLTPNAVWPTTKEWFLAVPFQIDSSLLGATTQTISRILSLDGVEAYPVEPDDEVFL